MSLNKTSEKTSIPKEKKETSKKKEQVSKTNERAKKAAKKETKDAKMKGTDKVKKSKEKKERQKPKPVILRICGQKVKKVGGKFFVLGKKTPISNLSKWIEGKMKDKKLIDRVDANLKDYSSEIKAHDEKKRDTLIRKLNKTKFSQVEVGEIEADGQKVKDPTKKAAYLASLVAEKVNPRTLVISQKALDKVKHKKYLDYNHILPVQARTILITLSNGKKVVASRAVDDPKKGGRVSYKDIVTGKRIYLKGEHRVQIIGTVSKSKAEVIQTTEQNLAGIRGKSGYLWRKGQEKPVRGSSSGGYSGGGGGGGHYAPSSGDSPAKSVAPASVPAQAFNSPRLSEATEKLEYNQHTFDLPGTLFGSLVLPKKKMSGSLTLITYFPGMGSCKAFVDWYKKHPNGQKPPMNIAQAAASEDIESTKKRLLDFLKEMWAEGKNVALCWIGPSRQQLLHNKRLKKGEKEVKYWYNEFRDPNKVNAIYGETINQVKERTGQVPAQIASAGFSMGGLALHRTLEWAEKGKLQHDIMPISFDATYWTMSGAKERIKQGKPVIITYRPGTSTEKFAKNFIHKYKLKPKEVGKGTMAYTNPDLSNVMVIASSRGHSYHPSLLKAAWSVIDRKKSLEKKTA